MMERREDLEKSLKQFHSSIDLLQNTKKQSAVSMEQIVAYRDSVIKRFELRFDLLWKNLKDLLEYKFGILLNSPKKVFQEARVQKLLEAKELAGALEMTDDRNLSVHTYDNEIAEDVAYRAIEHYALMKKIAEKISF